MAIVLFVVPASQFGEASAHAFVNAIRPDANVGLATGNSPLPLYSALQQRGLPALRPFAVDEYVGPRDHLCSNRSFFERHWLTIPGATPVEQFDAAAASLEAEAGRFAGALDAAGGLDLVVLGIGMNGHLAFNEPGSDRDSTVRAVELAEETREAASRCWANETPTHGLTIGLREILGARHVLLLANGAAKSAIVARALEGDVDPSCPASFLQEHPRLVVVLDEAAAAQLSRR